MNERDIADDYTALAEATDRVLQLRGSAGSPQWEVAMDDLAALRRVHEGLPSMTMVQAVEFAIERLENEIDRGFDGADVDAIERDGYYDAVAAMRAWLGEQPPEHACTPDCDKDDRWPTDSEPHAFRALGADSSTCLCGLLKWMPIHQPVPPGA